eukprot:762487-Hanusia_phi.AAC.1
MKASRSSRRLSLPNVSVNASEAVNPGDEQPAQTKESRRPSLLQLTTQERPDPHVELEKKVEEAARRNKYGCPSRLKQLLCLAKSVKNIRSKKILQDAELQSPTVSCTKEFNVTIETSPIIQCSNRHVVFTRRHSYLITVISSSRTRRLSEGQGCPKPDSICCLATHTLVGIEVVRVANRDRTASKGRAGRLLYLQPCPRQKEQRILRFLFIKHTHIRSAPYAHWHFILVLPYATHVATSGITEL